MVGSVFDQKVVGFFVLVVRCPHYPRILPVKKKMIVVHFEDREWDADVVGSDDPADDDHRRPDIVCTHPLTGMRYGLDNTIAWWALSGRGVGYDATGKFSKVVETWKKTAYAKAQAREEERWRRKI